MLVRLTRTTGRLSYISRICWLAIALLSIGILIKQSLLTTQGVTDFWQDYQAAKRLLHGAQPYLPLPPVFVSTPAPAFYDPHPPLSILFAVPFALFPLSVATALWGICSVTAYFVTGRLLLHALGWRTLPAFALFAFFSVLWLPLIGADGAQNYGQLVTLLLVVAWLLDRRFHGVWTGGLLGIAGLIKFWPIGLLLLGLFRRQWRLILVGFASVPVVSLLLLACIGLSGYQAYLGPVQANEIYWVPNEGNISLVGAIARWFTGYHDFGVSLSPVIPGFSLPHAVLLGEATVFLLVVIVVGLLWWLRRQRGGEVAELLSWGILVTALLAGFPITWYWGAISLLLPLTTLILALRQMRRPTHLWYILLALSLVLLVPTSWIGPAVFVLVHQPVLAMILIPLPTYGLMFFLIVQFWLLHTWSCSEESELPRVTKAAIESTKS